jgi:uncharacterized protein YjbJ (UPF0337 family)
MDREHIKGTADKVKGQIKDTAGKVTGDRNLESEGKFDKAKGSAHNSERRRQRKQQVKTGTYLKPLSWAAFPFSGW